MSLRPEQLSNIQRFADDEDFGFLIEMLRLDYFEEWCKERDPVQRERLHLKQEALEDLVVQIRAVADQVAFNKRNLP
jgi:hypothetical protein|tara:strand:- start:48 stop:278 length:231 start_codon:yes stop_codon:yes gene_type:complete